MLGTGLSQASMFATVLIAARMLGSGTLGEYGIVQSTTGMLGLLAGMGLGLTTTKHVSELRDMDARRCGRIVGLATIISLASAGGIAFCLFLLAPVLAAETLKAPHLALVLRIAGITLFFNALNGVQIGTLTGLEAFKTILYINSVRAAMTFAFVTTGIWQWGLLGMFLGMAATASLICIVTELAQRVACANCKIEITYGRDVWREVGLLWRFTAPGLIALLIPGIVFWIVRTMLIQYPNGYAELGIFTAADQWTFVLVFIAANLNSTGLPILSNVYGSGDWLRYRKILLGNILLPLVTAALFAVAFCLGSPLLERIYGPSFAGMAPLLVLISLIGVMRVLGGTLGTFIVSIGEMWWGVMFNVMWGGVLIAATLLLLDRGAIGLALAYMAAYTLHSIWGSIFVVVRLRSVRADWLSRSAVY